MPIMANSTTLNDTQRVVTAVERALTAANQPTAQSNAVGVAQLVRTAIADLGTLTVSEQDLVDSIELALDIALDSKSWANALGTTQMVQHVLAHEASH